MYKKIIKTVICLVLVSTILGITSIVYAADNINTETTQEVTIYFDSTNSGWNNFTYMYCMIFGQHGNLAEYGSRKARCTNEGNGIWKYTYNNYYDLTNDDYEIYFCTDNWQWSTTILFDKSCIGDTVYCDGTTTQIDEYTSRTTILWRNHDNSKYASILTIKPTGEVVGNYCLNYQDPYYMFIDFLKENYITAISKSNKSEQEFINDIGYKLGLSGIEVERAIIYSSRNIKWYRESYIEPTVPLPSESIISTPTETQSNRILGDIDGNGEVTIVDSTCIQRHLAQLPVYVDGIGEPIK